MPVFAAQQDARGAVARAQNDFVTHTGQSVGFAFQAASEDILFDRVGESWNYGLPALWVFTGDQQALADWWEQQHPHSGRFLPAQYKPNLRVWQRNLQFETDTRMFNYHLTVPAPPDAGA